MYVGPEMFTEIADRDTARAVFAKTVGRIEMETHSYCNRRCSYCPNVVGDRLGENQHMPEDIWQTIVGDLEEIGYANWLVLNYYNEPLADRAILGRIAEMRRRLPAARLMIYSNGDYLDPDYIEALAEAGLDYLHVSIHLKQGDEYSDLYVINRINELSVRMGIPAKIIHAKAGESIIAQSPHRKLEIEVRALNFQKVGTDRGGLIGDIHTAAGRATPCTFPFVHFVIGYNGLIAPCCHIRSDRPEHRSYIYGNLRDYGSIFQAFTSAPAAAWRRELASEREKRSPCDSCSAGQLLDPAQRQVLARAYAKHVGAPETAA